MKVSENAAAPVCARHPERPAIQYCQKHYRYLCDACSVCAAPSVYCQHRTSCIIWFFDRENRRKEREEDGRKAIWDGE